jgi:acetyltransferase-like isoleucine patch superfamily enzyme
MQNVQIHPLSDVQSTMIGEGTRVWQYCIILPNAKIGKNCNICAHVLIESDVVVGDDVTVKSGVQLWDGVQIGDRVFIGPNVTFTNDKFPRSKQYPESFLKTYIEDDVSIGANVTILPGLVIGAGSMIGAGTVVTKDVPPMAIMVGNPGKVVGKI